VGGVFELANRFLLPEQSEQPVTASDGTLWRSGWAAFLHDLVELKMEAATSDPARSRGDHQNTL
jgi:hypothetical protein